MKITFIEKDGKYHLDCEDYTLSDLSVCYFLLEKEIQEFIFGDNKREKD
jgi:hypothetical protein